MIQQILKPFAAFLLTMTIGFASIFAFGCLPKTDKYESEINNVSVPQIYYVEIYKAYESFSTAKPNPCTLILELNESRNITLNREDFGDLDDTRYLESTLSDVFRQRQINGVFKEGSTEIEKTVIVSVASSIKYSAVIRLIKALEKTGATPVQLDIGGCFYKINGICFKFPILPEPSFGSYISKKKVYFQKGSRSLEHISNKNNGLK